MLETQAEITLLKPNREGFLPQLLACPYLELGLFSRASLLAAVSFSAALQGSGPLGPGQPGMMVTLLRALPACLEGSIDLRVPTG